MSRSSASDAEAGSADFNWAVSLSDKTLYLHPEKEDKIVITSRKVVLGIKLSTKKVILVKVVSDIVSLIKLLKNIKIILLKLRSHNHNYVMHVYFFFLSHKHFLNR